MNAQEMEDASLALAHQLSSDLQMQDAMETAEAAADYAGLSANQRKKVDKQRQREVEKQEAQQRACGGGGARDTSMDWLLNSGFERAYIEQERALGLPSRAGNVDTWKEGLAPAGTLQYREKKAPPKQVRTQGLGYEQIFLPAPAAMATATIEELVDISDLETWAQLAFPGTKTLNRIQSKVFPIAYNSLENMMVCAPTGAGKTNIAMLAFLALVKQHIGDGTLDRDRVKAVYVAPMKALAQEVVEKFGERLKPLGMEVREFTGDMQLTRQEVADSQLIVTTPEKWDVITRKGGDGSLSTLVNLIIIDEVHLLADDRGAVIETIVARTHRQVESSQSMVRLVGLSATLPNYEDVASFLRVSPNRGLFHFGPEFRPVRLDQTLIGVTEKNRVKAKDAMNRQCYEKMAEALKRGKQVMVFVHSRKDTGGTAEALRDLAGKHCRTELLENVHHEQYSYWKKEVDKSRSGEVQQLFAHGFGMHHAGMLRADRTLTERLFERGVIKVLCCTATLAWGVNLPAHTVIIKGTEMYNPERGGFVDLSILDVLQIFGRAGRPQYDTCGHAVLITAHKSLNMYLDRLGHQTPIESQLIKALPDHLNAEIINGTVNNLKEAAEWLSYTFLFIRLRKNPLKYGMSFEEGFTDPQADVKRLALVKDAAIILDQCMMVRFDPRSGNLAATDLGRIASHFYIKNETIDAFNSMLSAHISYGDALHVLCSAAEFDQLKMRPEELQEIDTLKHETVEEVKAAVEDTAGKVNVLLQAYVAQSRVQSFTLQSDTNYVAQNAGRISRALFEIALKRGWSQQALHFIRLVKSIDRRCRPDQSPLRQFGELPTDVLQKLEASGATLDQLVAMQSAEIGGLVRAHKFGSKIRQLVERVPWLEVDYRVQPITRGILRIQLWLTCAFEWADKHHGPSEPFWVWMEDGENDYIYHSEYHMLHKKGRDEPRKIEFTIPVREPLPTQYFLRVVSDRWAGSEATIPVSFKHLLLPDQFSAHTPLMDLHPVPVTALQNPLFQSLYPRFTHFNPVQTQTFHVLYHTTTNVLVGAPTGSGKTITAELALLKLLRDRPGKKAVYVAPLKALARERVADWKRKLGGLLGLNVVELTGDVTPDMALLKSADVIITTPEKWDGITRGWQRRSYVQAVELVIIDEIHLLGVDRGPVLEVIVSRMRYIAAQTRSPIRFVGLSTALANAQDLGNWLGIGRVGVYNFRPAVRPIPMRIHIQGFPEKAYCPRMATMNKPCYAAIKEHSPSKPVLIFVSSRRQTRLTALDLISYCASDESPRQFLHMPEEEASNIASTLNDKAARDCLVFGIGIHHAGLDEHDRSTAESLFCTGKIQVLVCTSTLAWGVNFPAHLVIVKGTEFFDGKLGRYVDFPVTDVLQMMGRAGRPQFDTSGVACIFVHEPKKTFYKKFLHEPFPVESSLHEQLHNHLNAEVASGGVSSLADCVEWLSYTYLFRRLCMNPSYYNLGSKEPAVLRKYLEGLLDSILGDLEAGGCITRTEEFYLAPTQLGKTACAFYLDYRSVGLISARLQAWSDAGDWYAAGRDGEEEALSTLCKLISDVQEYAELPVRHNEEDLNAALAQELPWAVDKDSLNNAHTKTFLLLQAHFFREPLPISDYINDTKSVLDQLPRVLGAVMELASHMGLLQTVQRCMLVTQMSLQARHPGDSELLQLPSVTSEDVESLEKRGITTLLALADVGAGARQLLRAGDRWRDLWAVLKEIPALDITAVLRVRSVEAVVCELDSDEAAATAATAATTAVVGPPAAAVTSPPASMELAVTIKQTRGSPRAKVRCPKYPKKVQTLNYWLVACTDGGALLDVKYLGALHRGEMQAVLPVHDLAVPQQCGATSVRVHVVPNCFMGPRWSVQATFNKGR
jgi:activating signal cointegrator complex subunit 3